MPIPEWLEYWIAKTDTSYYIISITFFSLIGSYLKKIKSKKERKRTKLHAEYHFFKRN